MNKKKELVNELEEKVLNLELKSERVALDHKNMLQAKDMYLDDPLVRRASFDVRRKDLGRKGTFVTTGTATVQRLHLFLQNYILAANLIRCNAERVRVNDNEPSEIEVVVKAINDVLKLTSAGSSVEYFLMFLWVLTIVATLWFAMDWFLR